MRAGRWLPYAFLGVVLVAALAFGARSAGTAERTPEERVAAISATVRCPECPGQSAADSNTPGAVAVRQEIERRVAAGQSDEEIRAALASSFGQWIDLNPPRSGVAGLVWVLPVVAGVVAVAGLVLAFRRWSTTGEAVASPSDEDRRLVERARHGEQG